jgi:thiamine-phosphate pyrophosphorylase
MEDIARFVLDDGELSQQLKDLRHELGAVVAALGLDAGELLTARDAAGDVGTANTSAGEAARATLADVAASAAGRFAEAVRAIEECAKLIAPAGSTAAWQRAEQCRYRGYDLDKQLRLRLGSSARRQWGLCVLLTESLCTHHTWWRVAEAAVAGGAECLQLREKALDDHEFLARARALVDFGHAHNIAVVINDRPDIALAAHADGVHVGQTDLSVAAVRAVAGFRLLVGVSTANIVQARRAYADGADVCGVGPMFVSSTKPKPELSGIEYLRQYLAEPGVCRIPHLAISGITPATARELGSVGCKGIAVSSVVCGSEHPEQVCQELLAALRPSGSAT